MKIPVTIFATRCADSGEIEVWGGERSKTNKIVALRRQMSRAGFAVGPLVKVDVGAPPAPIYYDVQVELPFHELAERESKADRNCE